MSKINLLDPKVFNRISAGEVVERPASIVKELIENSIDAGAKNISIEIEEGGKKNITISDDGSGIAKDDLPLAFLPHATSKIKEVDDLDNITSLGFRGEALASIASVCQVKLSSRTANSDCGYAITVDGGEFGEVEEVARSQGTTISCSNLFFNTPVREKFLKKTKLEESEVTHLVEKFMLCRSDICFKYFIDGKLVYNTTSCSLKDIIYTIYGKEVYQSLLPVELKQENFVLHGFVSKPSYSRANRTNQSFFVNRRYVENYTVSSAVQSVYENFLMKGRFPFFALFLEIPTDSVDVNVHPSKKEVKFDNPGKVFTLVRTAVEQALLSDDQVSKFVSGENKNFAQNAFLPHFDNEIAKRPLFESPLSKNEGQSFSENQTVLQPDSVDLISGEVNIENEKLETEKVPNSKLPDFANIKLGEREVPANNRNNVVFFDQDETHFLSDIKTENLGKTEKFLKANVRDEMKILGTVFKTYIAIEYDDNLYFIDQHAAHERLLYDKLLKQVDSKSKATQALLVPFKMKLNAKELEAFSQMSSNLVDLGFELEEKGDEVILTAVPAILSGLSLDSFVDEIVKEGANWDKKKSDFVHNKLCQSACKHAIKAGDTISIDECAYIIEQVRKGVMLCPHGRPITLVISKSEFEKMFKRTL